jgi:hypothetical protein
METILRLVERKYGKARRIWVLNRGIVSEENLEAIRKRGGQYRVGTPRSQLKQFETELLKGLDTSAVGEEHRHGTAERLQTRWNGDWEGFRPGIRR